MVELKTFYLGLLYHREGRCNRTMVELKIVKKPAGIGVAE